MPRSLFLAALLLITLAASAALAQKCPCETYESSVTIAIRSTGENAIDVDKPRVCVARGGSVIWDTADGESFEIRFDKGDGTPFAQANVRGKRNERARNGVSRQNNLQCGRLFRYSVVLRKGGRDIVHDPEMIVEGTRGNP